jgi:hypothetical protein
MQLMYLRQAAMNRVLTYDEIKTLEILTKVKNTELDKRQPKDDDTAKKANKKMLELAKSFSIEAPKTEQEKVDDKATNTISKVK